MIIVILGMFLIVKFEFLLFMILLLVGLFLGIFVVLVYICV